VIPNVFTPWGTIFLVFPLENFLDLKIPGVFTAIVGAVGAARVAVFAALNRIPDHAGEVDKTKAAAPDIDHRVPAIQGFSLGNAGGDAIEVDRLAGVFIGYGRGHVFDGFATVGAVRLGDGFGRKLGGLPFGAVKKGRVFITAAAVLEEGAE
jgi:hypothetical protein